ncbi:MAG: six-cysteine ranthipeptide SCIFF [Desulfotomaculales bacterium]
MGQHVITVIPAQIREGEPSCQDCQVSCQSACKTSCTVGNQTCASENKERPT